MFVTKHTDLSHVAAAGSAPPTPATYAPQHQEPAPARRSVRSSGASATGGRSAEEEAYLARLAAARRATFEERLRLREQHNGGRMYKYESSAVATERSAAPGVAASQHGNGHGGGGDAHGSHHHHHHDHPSSSHAGSTYVARTLMSLLFLWIVGVNSTSQRRYRPTYTNTHTHTHTAAPLVSNGGGRHRLREKLPLPSEIASWRLHGAPTTRSTSACELASRQHNKLMASMIMGAMKVPMVQVTVMTMMAVMAWMYGRVRAVWMPCAALQTSGGQWRTPSGSRK